MEIFDKLIDDFRQSSTWLEGLLIVAALALSYALVRLAGQHFQGRGRSASIWLGHSPLSGALWPLLALLLLLVAQGVVVHFMPVFWLRLAVSLLLSLSVIRFVARVLSYSFPHSTGMRLVERVFSWLAWGVAVLHSLELLPLVLQQLDAIRLPLGKLQISVLGLIEAGLSAGLTLVLVLWLASLLEQHLLVRWVSDLSMRKVAMNIIRVLLITVGLLLSLSWVGVDLTTLSVMGGAVGVGLGFGLQKIASNYISGFLVLIERALRIGDNVRVDGFEGRITDIKTRFTVIRASNGRESIVPNETLITQRVENLTQFDQQLLLSTTLVVGMDSDLQQVQQIFLDAAQQCPRVLAQPAPSVQLTEFVPHGLQLSLNYYIGDPENGQANVRSQVNTALLQGLRNAGVELPVPRQTLEVLSAASQGASGSAPA